MRERGITKGYAYLFVVVINLGAVTLWYMGFTNCEFVSLTHTPYFIFHSIKTINSFFSTIIV